MLERLIDLSKFGLKFYRITNGSIIQKLRKTRRYASLYLFHKKHQQLTYAQNLKAYQNHIQINFDQNILKQWHSQAEQYFQRQAKVFHDKKDSSTNQERLQSFLKSGFYHLSLYYESLQNLIEGRREVLHNQNYTFEDGESVKQKKIKFEQFLAKYFGKHQDNPSEQDQNGTGSQS